MKFKITLMVMLGLFCLFPNHLSSQCDIQRAAIQDLTPTEQCELRNLMLDYLSIGYDPAGGFFDWQDYPIVDMHTNPAFGSFGNFHNYAEEFATWHRNYVQGMEEYILSQGYPQYTPLPYWSPHTMIPDAFYNYAGCGATYANLPESVDFPQYTDQGPFSFSDTNNNGVQDPGEPIIDFTVFDAGFNCVDWATVDAFVGDMEGINWPTNGNHDATHGAVGGTLGPPNSAPASTLFWLFHAYITDLHSCYLRECDNAEADIYVRDNAPDNGSEPTGQTTQLWTSPDIWVRNEPDGFANTTVEELCYKINDDDEIKPVYVYVRTWNKGNAPSKNGDNDIEVYWAKPSAGLNWPSPWDAVPSATSCGLPLGNFIASQPLRSVNGQYLDVNDVDMDGNNTEIIEGYTIYEFQWLPPDPAEYEACFGPQGWEKGHFCIHARVDDGDGFDLSGGFTNHLINNNDLALKNIYIYGEDDNNVICDDIIWAAPPGGCIFFGNYSTEVMANVGLNLSFPTSKDKALLENNEINLTLKDGALKKWQNGGGNGEGIKYNKETAKIEFTKANGFIGGLTLKPMEIYRFCLEIVGPEKSNGLGLQLDIVQTVDGEEVGGERFLINKVIPVKKGKKSGSNTSIDLSSNYEVYPNPSTGQITVSLNNFKDDHNILISNSVGQTMKKLTNVIGDKTIDVSDLGKGIFFISIKNQKTGTIDVQKLLIQ